MLLLKDYQQRTLHSLRAYLRRCSEAGDADTAFYATTRETFGTGIPYRPVAGFPGLPYVCMRIPTGGGKTLVACHSVHIAATELLQTDDPVVVWLVPSNTIQQQTVAALKDRSHPYRQALDSGLESVTVVDVEQALSLSHPQLDSGGTIIVSTLQSFRVEDTLGRRVYRDSGQLMDHFTRLAEETTRPLEHGEHGNLLHSLANVLRLRRPLVIVDEAHNARTHLSFDTLQRLDPSCIVEFTATPDTKKNPSNVLHSVSARELKAEAMIKMPIRLETRPDWKELLSDAVSCRDTLESIAASEQQETGEYLRPIILIQAQPHRKNKQTITVETVHECLISEFDIPSEQVAVATGSQRDLEGIDVLSPATPVRYIITMQALREGWDCPFAYVLCSVAEIASPTYVEQILGRIMRLPNAAWKNHQELNVAYAFAASRRFLDAANTLTDALVQNGFERQEAEDFIVPARADAVGTLFSPADLIPETSEVAKTPSGRRLSFSVPLLAVRQGSLLEPLEETHFLDHVWDLTKCDASLSPEEYSPSPRRAQVGEIDIATNGRVRWRFIEQLHQDTASAGRQPRRSSGTAARRTSGPANASSRTIVSLRWLFHPSVALRIRLTSTPRARSTTDLTRGRSTITRRWASLSRRKNSSVPSISTRLRQSTSGCAILRTGQPSLSRSKLPLIGSTPTLSAN